MTSEPLRPSTTGVRALAPVAGRRPTGATRPVGREPHPSTTPRTSLGQMCIVLSTLADGDGQALVRNLRQRGSGRVILLARQASRRELVVLLSGGLRGAIATETQSSVTPERVAPPHGGTQAALTARELGVLALVADGCSNRAVGEQLGLSALTVKSHLARISRKLGTGDRAALVATAIRSGLLD